MIEALQYSHSLRIWKETNPTDSENIPGKPPSVFRSHNLVVPVSRLWVFARVSTLLSSLLVGSRAWMMSTVKTPPVEGIKATSPREVENVERSSWAN